MALQKRERAAGLDAFGETAKPRLSARARMLRTMAASLGSVCRSRIKLRAIVR